MLSAEALDSLAEAESLLTQTADAILRLTPGPAADFAGYVWFVLTALEQLQRVPNAPDIGGAVQRLLGFDQMDAPLRDRWFAFAAAVQRTYDATDPAPSAPVDRDRHLARDRGAPGEHCRPAGYRCDGRSSRHHSTPPSSRRN